jgi:hypothetical protein
MGKKHIVSYSGGHSSAIVAIEVARRFGAENVILCNHDCILEDKDVARFEQQVAAYLGIPITYVNFDGHETKDQFDVVIEKGSFVNTITRQALCTTVMKTEPFMKWLEGFNKEEIVVYYGFDKNEEDRILRRSTILASQGYKSDYPLALWRERTIYETSEIGIERPMLYNKFKHANCVGCLKAGKQHWYIVYCEYPDIFAKAIRAEEEIGYSILSGGFLSDIVPEFELMKKAGVKPTEHIPHQKFWADARKRTKGVVEIDFDAKPCECLI